jgi:hypothetical protein
MGQILAFSGKKQSGKNTLCNFLHGYQLKSYGIIDAFEITDQGELVIETLVTDTSGKTQSGQGIIDITRVDMDFAIWAIDNVWPFVKHYAFATTLKEIAISLFNIDKELLYGTDQQKNTPIKYKWEDMPIKIKGKTGEMTAREFIQYFGTDICRKIYPDVWTDRAIKDILAEQSNFAIISDARFENEVEAVKKAGGKIIRLTRFHNEDSHVSESALDNYNGFDYVLDNANMSIEESCKELLKVLDEWKWLSKDVVLNPPEQVYKRQAVTSIK